MPSKIFLAKSSLQVKESPVHGYGVYTLQTISAEEIIEECPVLIVANKLVELNNYWFHWEPYSENQSGIALGYGSIYNHSVKPNAIAIPDFANNLLTIKALKKISPGEEIFIFYGKKWFESRKIKRITPLSEKKDTLQLLSKILVITGITFFLHYFFRH